MITLPGEYRWVGELNIKGVWGKYSSRNMLRLTQHGTVTIIPAEVEGFPSDRHKLTLEGHTEGVLSVAFSPDSSTLASGSWDHTVRLWDANTGQHKLTLEGHTGDVNSVVFSPDSSTLVSGGNDYTIQIYDDMLRLWDAKTGEPLQTLKGHRSGVTSLAFSMDGSSTMASGSWDRTVQV